MHLMSKIIIFLERLKNLKYVTLLHSDFFKSTKFTNLTIVFSFLKAILVRLNSSLQCLIRLAPFSIV